MNFQMYGSSPDALAAQQRGYENLYNDAAVGNVNRATQANDITFRAYLQQQEQERQAQESAAKNNFDAWRVNQANAENTRQFNVTRAAQDTAAAQDFALRNRQLDIQAVKPNPVLEKQNQFEYLNAMDRASNGDFSNVKDVVGLFPSLRADQIMQVLDWSKKTRPDIQSAFMKQQGDADTLNESNRMKDYIGLSTEARDAMPKTVRRFDWKDFSDPYLGPVIGAFKYARGTENPNRKTQDDFIKDWTGRQTELAVPVAAIQKDKDWLQHFQVGNSGYAPALPRPAWLPQPQTATATSAPRFQEGQRVQDKNTGLFYRIRNGVPVPE